MFYRTIVKYYIFLNENFFLNLKNYYYEFMYNK